MLESWFCNLPYIFATIVLMNMMYYLMHQKGNFMIFKGRECHVIIFFINMTNVPFLNTDKALNLVYSLITDDNDSVINSAIA